MRKLLLACVLATGLLGLLAAPAFARPKTFTVSPSGGNDTANIQEAFNDAVAAGPGSTVQLTAGRFTINDILVTGFQGTFQGAGKDRTVIDCPPGGVQLENGMPVPFLLGFQDGAVTLSDLSFDVTPSVPAASWYGGDYLNSVVFLFGERSTAFDSVGFTAHSGDFYGLNTDWSVIATPDAANTGGVYSMSGCTCATLEGFGEDNLTGATITIGGNAGQGNAFTSEGMACGFFETSASHVTVTGNRLAVGNPFGADAYGNQVLYSAGVSIEQDNGLGLTPSSFLVSHNCFEVGPPADAVDLFDVACGYGEGQKIDAVVAGNAMHLTGDLGTPFVLNAGGIGEYYAQNVSVLANRIWGVGAAAMFGGTPSTGDVAPGSVSGWKIVANDVRGMNALPQSAGGPGAPIWLGPGSTDCLVVGGPAPTYVLDQGTGNKLIHATAVADPPIAAAAASKLASLREMKSLR